MCPPEADETKPARSDDSVAKTLGTEKTVSVLRRKTPASFFDHVTEEEEAEWCGEGSREPVDGAAGPRHPVIGQSLLRVSE